jgi:hypothetical protein
MTPILTFFSIIAPPFENIKRGDVSSPQLFINGDLSKPMQLISWLSNNN